MGHITVLENIAQGIGLSDISLILGASTKGSNALKRAFRSSSFNCNVNISR